MPLLPLPSHLRLSLFSLCVSFIIDLFHVIYWIFHFPHMNQVTIIILFQTSEGTGAILEFFSYLQFELKMTNNP